MFRLLLVCPQPPLSQTPTSRCSRSSPAHCRCWPARSDLGRWWPCRLVATAAEDCLNADSNEAKAVSGAAFSFVAAGTHKCFFGVVAGRIDPDHMIDNPMAAAFANRGCEPWPPIPCQDLQPAQTLRMEHLLSWHPAMQAVVRSTSHNHRTAKCYAAIGRRRVHAAPSSWPGPSHRSVVAANHLLTAASASSRPAPLSRSRR